MKRPVSQTLLRGWLWLLALLAGFSGRAGTLPSEWQRHQQFSVPEAGLIKLSLPIETLDSARPGLADLRLYDNAGHEVPYLLERPEAASKGMLQAKAFDVSLQANATVIILETGVTQPLDGVTFDTPASSFVKAVQVEGSKDKRSWQMLAEGLPIFRQANGVTQLRLAVPPGAWQFLRLTIDDRRSPPVPFTGARVHTSRSEPTPSEPLPVAISERYENPGETRLTLNLGAANLNVSRIEIEASEPLFTRRVRLAVPEISEETIQERPLAEGVFYRVAIEGQPVSANLSMALEAEVRSRELLLLIQNHDSPPLSIAAVRAERRPVYLVFLARQSGIHHLLTGNNLCLAPRYDLASLGPNLKGARLLPLNATPVTNNPSYRPPEALAGIRDSGAALDVKAWNFRKLIQLAPASAQQLELDLDVLAQAEPGLQDLRLLRDGKQLPYIVERTSISRTLTPVVTSVNDPKKPKQSRWAIKLSHRRLPARRLVCVSRTPLFQREMVLYEDLATERGDKYRRIISQGSWTRTPESADKELSLTWNEPLQTDALLLETDNGDNPPIELEQFRLFHPMTRVLFRAKPTDEIFLYYGNSRAGWPRYDLSLIAGQLLAADKGSASLGREEPLKKSLWRKSEAPGKSGPIFWGILGLVVVVLLLIISRLLPKPPSSGS